MSNIQSESQPVRKAVEHGGIARRRLLRAGLAAPVILTVGSRSALANGGCLSPSASASIDLFHSRPDRPRDQPCAGRTPGYWQNAAKTHNDILAQDTQYSNPYAGGFLGMTIEQVMELTGVGNGGGNLKIKVGLPSTGDPYQLGAHLGAAWCNLQRGWVDASVLSLSTLQAMWDGRSGYYPVAGDTKTVWYAEEIVAYLKTTMTL